MKKLWNWAIGYLAAGIGMELVMVTIKEAVRGTASLAGLAAHAHLLLMGFGFTMLLIVLDKLFQIADDAAFGGTGLMYNIGLIGAAAAMSYKGICEIAGGAPSVMVVMGVSAVSHIIVSVALFRYAFIFRRAIARAQGSALQG